MSRSSRPVSSRNTSSRRPALDPQALGQDAALGAPGRDRGHQPRVHPVRAPRSCSARPGTPWPRCPPAARPAARPRPGRARPGTASWPADPHSSAGCPSATSLAVVDDDDAGRPAARLPPCSAWPGSPPRPAARRPSISSQVACRACGSRPGRRLVQEHQLRAADHRGGQRQPLLLAAGQPPVRGACRSRPGRARSAGAGSMRAGVEPGLHPQVLRRPGRGRDAAGLEHDADPGPQRRGRRAPGPGRAPGPCRRRAAGSPRRSRWWWSCPPRSAPGSP